MEMYAEKELLQTGFKRVNEVGETRISSTAVTLSMGHTKIRFDCVCPSYPQIRALGCPLHTKFGSSWPVEEAKCIARLLREQ